ncbi:MAG TPA: LysM domain-containing protein [Actinomycetes bacterium]
MQRVGRGVRLLGGLACLEVALVRVAGPVAGQVRALGGLGDRVVDPVAGLLAVLAVAAELLAGYLVLVVALRVAAWLPGVPGLLAGRGARLVALPVLSRALDGLLGGVLLAQAVFAPAVAWADPASAPPDRPPAAAASALAGGAAVAGARNHPGFDRGGHGSALPGAGARQPGPPGVPPTGSTAPSPPWVPLPTWLGGSRPPGVTATTAGTTTTAPGSPSAAGVQGPGASRAGDAAAAAEEAGHGPAAAGAGVGGRYVVRPGDTLWDIAAAHLPRGRRSPGRIDRYWRRVYAANRGVLGDDPGLIHPGARLVLPPVDAAARGHRRP